MLTTTKNQLAADHGFVHVHLDRLDGLLNLVGELVINRAALGELGRRARAKHGFKAQVLDLVETIEQVGRITDEIQERVIKARMVPVEHVFNRFRGFLKDLPGNADKQIDLVIRGENTEVDKRIIEELAEPLVHLVRNAVDHGLETTARREKEGKPGRGRVTLNALHEGNQLIIEVHDDGAGVDVEAVRQSALEKGIAGPEELAALDDAGVIELLFHPRFSTSAEVTGMSGRGVGLEAAKRQIELLGGNLSIESTVGVGTCCCICLPITMAIIQAILADVGGETYAFPVEHVVETVRARSGDVATVESCEVLELRGQALPLSRLSRNVELEREEEPESFYVVVVHREGRRLGFVVDQVIGRQEIVIKPLKGHLSTVDGISGATIAGDGTVFLILDIPVLCDRILGETEEKRPVEDE